MTTLLTPISWRKLFAWTIAVAGLYFVTARIGLTLAVLPGGKATAVWPPSGIALAALLHFGGRIWPGIWFGAFCANLWDSVDPTNVIPFYSHFAVSVGIASGSTAQALLGSSLLRHWLGERAPLNRARSVFLFVMAAVLMCVVAATIGSTTVCLAGFSSWEDFSYNWWTWWLGDTLGVLVFTPLALCWSQSPAVAWSPRRVAEFALILVLLVVVGLTVFVGWNPWGIGGSFLSYMTIPLVVWAAFRFMQHGATFALLVVSGFAAWGSAHGYGPFFRDELYESLLILQTFVGVLALTALALSGVLAERREAEIAQASLVTQLQTALDEIKALRGMIPICAWCKKIRNESGSWQQLEVYLNQHLDAEFSHGICPGCAEQCERSIP